MDNSDYDTSLYAPLVGELDKPAAPSEALNVFQRARGESGNSAADNAALDAEIARLGGQPAKNQAVAPNAVQSSDYDTSLYAPLVGELDKPQQSFFDRAKELGGKALDSIVAGVKDYGSHLLDTPQDTLNQIEAQKAGVLKDYVPSDAGYAAAKAANAQSVSPRWLAGRENLEAQQFATNPDKFDPTSLPPGTQPLSKTIANSIAASGKENAVVGTARETASRVYSDATSGAAGATGSTLSYIGRKFGLPAIEYAGDRLQYGADVTRPTNPNLGDKLVDSIAGVGAFYVPGAGLMKGTQAIAVISETAAPYIGAGTMAALGAAGAADHTYKELVAKGYSEEQASKKADEVFFANAALQLGADKIGIFNNFKNTAVRLGVSGTTFAAQNAASTAIGNQAAGRPIGTGAEESALIGGLTGPFVGAAHHATEPRNIAASEFAKTLNDTGLSNASNDQVAIRTLSNNAYDPTFVRPQDTVLPPEMRAPFEQAQPEAQPVDQAPSSAEPIPDQTAAAPETQPNNTNFDAAMKALNSAGNIDEAIAGFHAASSAPLEMPAPEHATPAQDIHGPTIEEAQSLFGTPEWQVHRDSQEPAKRDSMQAIEKVIADPDIPAEQRAQIADQVLKYAKSSAEGNPEHIATVRQANEMMNSPEWRNHIRELPADSNFADIMKMNDKYAPMAERAEAGKRMLDYALENIPSGKTGHEILAETPFHESEGNVSLVDPNSLSFRGKQDGTIGKAQARFIQVLGNALDKNVHFFKQENATARTDGFVNPKYKNDIFINTAEGSAGWQHIAGHEFLHTMPDDIKESFIDAVRSEMPAAEFAQFKRYYSTQEGLTDKQFYEEASADLFGNRFGEKDFWDRVLGNVKNPTMAQRIVGYVRNFVDHVVQGLGFGKKFETDKYVKNLERIKIAASDALRQHLDLQGVQMGSRLDSLQGRPAEPALPQQSINAAPANIHPEPVQKQASGKPSVADQLRAIKPELFAGSNKPAPVMENSDLQRSVSRLIQNYNGPGRDLVYSTKDFLEKVQDEIFNKVAPMSMKTGNDITRATAKDWANSSRLAQWQWNRLDHLITKNFDEVQRREMWEAADEENVLRQQGMPTAGKGLERLTPDQREVMDVLHTYAEALLQRAKDVGMFDGEGLPYWTPRLVMMIDEKGNYTRPESNGGPESTSKEGRNISTNSSNLKQRKYLTTEETEAAASALAKEGQRALVIRDIRTMPEAMARLERAIAGRELVNQIKRIGQMSGNETVISSERQGFIEIPHPAFKTFGPKLEEVPVTAAELAERRNFVKDGIVYKMPVNADPNNPGSAKPLNGYKVDRNGNVTRLQVAMDANGKPIMESKSLWIAKEFEGPLKAIMTQPTGKVYNFFMAVKGKSMGVIMYSPLIHNAVEWSRAIPVSPGKVFSGYVYLHGNKFKNDPAKMSRAILNGMVPIGGRGSHLYDINSMMADPNTQVGKSLTAKVLGGTVGLVNEWAGQQVKKGIDAAGNFWHNTLLWDRIGDLQAGIYSIVENDMMRKGLPEYAAGKLAAHFANRYAGALPNEAMSQATRQWANLVLFSRSFTIGNIGAMKDIVTGLPVDIQSQIKLQLGEAQLSAAKSFARRKAMSAFMLDVGLMYLGNSLLQTAFDRWKRDKTMDEITKGYVDRFHDAVHRVVENPWHLLNPFGLAQSLTPNSENEPRKEYHIKTGADASGTNQYMRNPFGKIGEEFVNYSNFPSGTIEMFNRKLSPFLRPLLQTAENDKGFGRKVFDPDDKMPGASARNTAKIVWNFLSQQIPTDAIQGAVDWENGIASDIDKMKVLGPFIGLTYSKGAPGGPEVGQMYQVERQHQDAVARNMPDIQRSLKMGDRDKAIDMMRELKMSPPEMMNVLKRFDAPGSRLNQQSMRKFMQHASEEEKSKMDKMREQ